MGKKYSDYNPLSNEELAVLAQKGDEYAFDVLARRFLNTRYTFSNVAYVDSDDFVQEGMFGFLNAVRTFDMNKGVPFEAYASKCMSNSIKTAAGNVNGEVSVDGEDELLSEQNCTDDLLSHILVREHLNEVLKACEVSLSEVEKTVVFFRAAGLSYDEIGERLGMSPKSVDNAVQRARRKLKDVFAE